VWTDDAAGKHYEILTEFDGFYQFDNLPISGFSTPYTVYAEHYLSDPNDARQTIRFAGETTVTTTKANTVDNPAIADIHIYQSSMTCDQYCSEAWGLSGGASCTASASNCSVPPSYTADEISDCSGTTPTCCCQAPRTDPVTYTDMTKSCDNFCKDRGYLGSEYHGTDSQARNNKYWRYNPSTSSCEEANSSNVQYWLFPNGHTCGGKTSVWTNCLCYGN